MCKFLAKSERIGRARNASLRPAATTALRLVLQLERVPCLPL
jgi:hypothetical protein